jgi:hypothetical protein
MALQHYDWPSLSNQSCGLANESCRRQQQNHVNSQQQKHMQNNSNDKYKSILQDFIKIFNYSQ